MNLPDLDKIGEKKIDLSKLGLDKDKFDKIAQHEIELPQVNLENGGFVKKDSEKISLYELLFYPYHKDEDKKIKLSKIDIFFYSHLFRAIYTIFVLLYVVFANDILYTKTALIISAGACIYHGLGGACTIGILAWLLYNFTRILF